LAARAIFLNFWRSSHAGKMPKTNADYQREYRQRQARRLASLQAENATLRAQLGQARSRDRTKCTDLTAELKSRPRW
jgi:hypothetical protein